MTAYTTCFKSVLLRLDYFCWEVNGRDNFVLWLFCPGPFGPEQSKLFIPLTHPRPIELKKTGTIIRFISLHHQISEHRSHGLWPRIVGSNFFCRPSLCNPRIHFHRPKRPRCDSQKLHKFLSMGYVLFSSRSSLESTGILKSHTSLCNAKTQNELRQLSTPERYSSLPANSS